VSTEDLLPGGVAALDQPIEAGDQQQVQRQQKEPFGSLLGLGAPLTAIWSVVGLSSPISPILVGVRSRSGICVIS
jgi:hypothetical protein